MERCGGIASSPRLRGLELRESSANIRKYSKRLMHDISEHPFSVTTDSFMCDLVCWVRLFVCAWWTRLQMHRSGLWYIYVDSFHSFQSWQDFFFYLGHRNDKRQATFQQRQKGKMSQDKTNKTQRTVYWSGKLIFSYSDSTDQLTTRRHMELWIIL